MKSIRGMGLRKNLAKTRPVKRIVGKPTHHGYARKSDRNDPTYHAWQAMLQRCYNPRNSRYKHYGARGIKVCQRWRNFVNFLSDMGRKPKGLTLERNNNDRGYSPENCRWATYAEQNRNHRRNRWVSVDGVRLTAMDWSSRTGIHHKTICCRLDRGWSPKDAVHDPAVLSGPRKIRTQAKLTPEQVIRIRKLYANGDVTLNRLGKRFGVGDTTIYWIVKRMTWRHV